MTQSKQPMSLEDLPQYLEAQRQGRVTGNSPVVGMGQIVMPKRTNWLPRIAAAVIFVAVGVGGFIAYDVTSTNHLTVLVDIGQDADALQTIPKIVSESGGQVIAVKQNSSDTYEVKVSTRQSKSSFLNWLRKNKDVKKANLEE